MDDTISRQAVIDVVHKVMLEFFDYCEDDKECPMTEKDKMLLEINKKISNGIKDLPSVQAKQRCEYWDNESSFCALNRPAAQQEQRWIPVTERLPLPEPYMECVKKEGM